eukprot:COSAG01_NODE_22671_length_846_cov_0.771084_1_plen_70_part_00
MPGNAEEMMQLRQGFGSFMDLVVGEDFQLLDRMQRNFTTNPATEVVFGRHEPCLADRHRFFADSVQGHF